MSDIVSVNGYKIKDEKAVRSYESIADMKADTKLKEGYHVKTKGYYEANDGGHGEYVIVDDETLVDDGGLIHVLTNGLRAVLLVNNSVNIKQLGYVNTMTASEQTTFLNDVFSKFDNILIKDETITINDSLAVKSNQIIRMENSKIHNVSETNQTFIFQLNGVENVNITGLNSEIYFDKPSTPQQACLKIFNSKNVYFDGIDLKSAGGDGITVSGTDNTTISSNINISNCTIDNNRRNGVSLIGGVKGFHIKNCIIKNTSGVNPQYGIDLETWQDEVYNEDITIEQCNFEGNVGDIDLMPYNNNIKIINNIITKSINSVITVAKGENAYPKNIIIDNNEFDNSAIYLRGTQYGEYKIINNNFKNGGRIITDSESDFTNFYQTGTKSGYLHIINNSIKNSSTHGIAITSSCNVLIKDNYIEKPLNRGISVSASNNVKIVNNTIKDYAQNETNKDNIFGIYIATTYNTLIDGNIFFNSQEVTFLRVISIQASCQRLITVNNIALDLTYTNFLGKDGTITNEVYDNNLINS